MTSSEESSSSEDEEVTESRNQVTFQDNQDLDHLVNFSFYVQINITCDLEEILIVPSNWLTNQADRISLILYESYHNEPYYKKP